MKNFGYAARSPTDLLTPFRFDRRDLRINDVGIEILYCGVCHSDLHMARNDWGWTTYPVVPGHEIVGRVSEVGEAVTRYQPGDIVAVGCLVDSCRRCDRCEHGQEQFCRNGRTDTYNANDRIDGRNNYGGYAKYIVAREEFVLRIPAGMNAAKAAPLLCAGITVYSPMKVWNVGARSRVGVVGLGGLGHMAVKIGAAMGAEITVLSRSIDKRADALALGARHFLPISDERAMSDATNAFDLIVDTVPVKHDINPYMPLLEIDGTLCLVGQVGPLVEPATLPLIIGRRRIAGSTIGGLPETQEMLDFCAHRGVTPEVEIIRMDQINEAFDRLERADVRYRFVIDMSSLSP